jgi:hypothetical protein
MDRHFQCLCGKTAWITRENGFVSIECVDCGLTVSGETLLLAREQWRLLVRSEKYPERPPRK